MKKTYIQPSVEVVKIQTNMMIAASPNDLNVKDEEMSSGDTQFSRRGFFNDEEEDW